MTDGLRSLLVVTGTMEFYDFPWILGTFLSHLTNSYFSEGWRKTTNQRWFAKMVLLVLPKRQDWWRSLKTPQLQSYQQHQQTGRIVVSGAKSLFFFPNPNTPISNTPKRNHGGCWATGVWYWRDGFFNQGFSSVVAKKKGFPLENGKMTIAHILWFNHGMKHAHRSCETRNAGESGYIYTFSSRKIYPIRCLAKESKGIWRFPKMGVPQNHGFQY